MILVDTAPLVAAAIDNDDNHDRCVDVFNQMQQSGRSLLVPSFVAHEACFMLKRDGGARTAARFMRSLAAGGAFRPVELDNGDMRRVAELLVIYEDLGLDAADAAVIAIARATASRHCDNPGLSRFSRCQTPPYRRVHTASAAGVGLSGGRTRPAPTWCDTA
jgi:predicted nucleic acid-binding protein